MVDLVARVLQRLEEVGVRLDPGLSDVEISWIQDRLGFSFGPEHRQLLQSALPVGGSWPDWRGDPPEELLARLEGPVDGVVFDVHHNGFWPSSWGERPDGWAAREGRARHALARVPRLVPLFSHRFLAVDPAYQPSPVFSVHQSDVIFYGDDLLDYVAHEFGRPPRHPSPDRVHVPFWSDLAEGADGQDL